MDYPIIRKDFVHACLSMFQRGFVFGGAGNVSLKLPNGNILTTPTGESLGRLKPENLSIVNIDGEYISGNKPSKEAGFHLAIYRNQPTCGAIVHLHSTALTALSCHRNLNLENAIQAFTPYYVMRIGKLPVVPYYKPGSSQISEHLAKLAPTHRAFLLANHGPIVCGSDLYDAIDNAEELEETAKLHLMLQDHSVRHLSEDEIQELKSLKK
jgi:L-ribulose-5-phosphate 4-epimerase